MKKNIIVLVALIIAILAGLIIRHKLPITKKPVRRFEIVDIAPPYSVKPTEVKQVFSGKVRKLDKKLDLFDYKVDGEKKGIYVYGNASEATTNYFEAGEFISGKYKGYKRIIAIRADAGYKLEPSPYVFATKDYKEYIYNKDTGVDRSVMLNSVKITEKDILDTEAIDEIPVDDQFVLIKEPIGMMQDTIAIDSDPDKTGGISMKSILKTNFEEKDRLKSNYTNLNYYESPIDIYFGGTPNEIHSKYFSRISEVIVTDSTGVGYRYFVARKDTVAKNRADLEEKKWTYLGLSFLKNETNIQTSIFDKYLSFNQGCMMPKQYSFIANVQDGDLEKIGEITNNHIAIYILKDKQSQVISNSYSSRFSPGREMLIGKEEELTKPSQQEYLSKNPLIFIKDPWGRYILMQEYDYHYTIPCA